MANATERSFDARDLMYGIGNDGHLTADVVRDGLRLTIAHEGMGWRDVTIAPDDAVALLAWLVKVCGVEWEGGPHGSEQGDEVVREVPPLDSSR